MPEPVQILSPARHERHDVRFRYVAAGASWVALVLAIVLLTAWWLFPRTMTDQYVAEPTPAFASPQLQSSPRLDMNLFRAQQRAELDGLYWLDRAHGVVHLPIEDAMRKVAAEGIPDWPKPKEARR
ncbi:MAG: hypothetical protein RQ966_00795 [Acetobacteraceae bacterium]|nr:hypothetical protein [Acetobacteraceae bacterium]